MADQKKAPTELSDDALENVDGGMLDYEWIAITAPGDVAGVKGKDKGGSFYEAGDLNNVVKKGG